MKMSNQDGCILSIDAGGTFLKAALVYSNGIIIKNSLIKIPIDSYGSAENIKSTYTQIALLGIEEAKKYNLILKGIGVSIPGPFNYNDGVSLMKHKYASIYGISIRPWFEQVAGKVPIRFVHDSNAFILGATWGGRYSNFKRIAAVTIGTGLGFASMFNSKLFTNSQGGPGISIYARPYRGKTAEEYVSRRAIIAHYKELVPEVENDIDVIDIANLARAGQTQAVKTFEDIGTYLAEILHDVIYYNAFECLILGGAISKSSDLFIPTLSQGLSDVPTLTVIEQAEDIDNAPLLGVAKAILDLV